MTTPPKPTPIKAECQCDRKREELLKLADKVHRHSAALEGALREIRLLVLVECETEDKAA